MIDLRATPNAGRYNTVLLDPPWKFAAYSAKGLGKSADRHYPTMSLDAIRRLPVAEVCAPDCWMAMWTTWPHLDQALLLMSDYGFRYVSGGAWAKQSRTGRAWAFGTGYIFRSASELLLLGRRGSPKWLSKSERNLWVAPIREHSRKPDEVHEMLERATAGPRLEMFSRTDRAGWDSWGLETGKFT